MLVKYVYTVYPSFQYWYILRSCWCINISEWTLYLYLWVPSYNARLSSVCLQLNTKKTEKIYKRGERWVEYGEWKVEGRETCFINENSLKTDSVWKINESKSRYKNEVSLVEHIEWHRCAAKNYRYQSSKSKSSSLYQIRNYIFKWIPIFI